MINENLNWDDLLPCKHCNSAPFIDYENRKIYCKNHPKHMIMWASKENAIMKWNNRNNVNAK